MAMEELDKKFIDACAVAIRDHKRNIASEATDACYRVLKVCGIQLTGQQREELLDFFEGITR